MAQGEGCEVLAIAQRGLVPTHLPSAARTAVATRGPCETSPRRKVRYTSTLGVGVWLAPGRDPPSKLVRVAF